MAETWRASSAAGPAAADARRRAEFCDGGAVWREAPLSPQHPAAGARWRLCGKPSTAVGRNFDIELRSFSGARAMRAVHTGAMAIEEHSHDWPSLTLHMIGSYSEFCEDREISIGGPGAILNPPGAVHAGAIGEPGLEMISIHFDPRWLRCAGRGLQLDRSRSWTGGPAAAAARSLAGAWANPARSEGELAVATARFLRFAMSNEMEIPRPAWLDRVMHALDEPDLPSTNALARRLDLSSGWLARTYRGWVGEGLRDTLRRKRVERASALLRHSQSPLADIAASVGFCDQSHMNRAFRLLTDRTPIQVRAEPQALNGAAWG